MIKNIFKKIIKILKKKNQIKVVEIKSFYPSRKKGKNKIIPYNFFQTYKSTKVDIEHDKKYSEFRNKNLEFNYYFFD